MKNKITIREAVTEADIAAFWDQLHTYHKRDIFPDPEDEDLRYFLDDTEYRAQIERVHDRPQDNCYYLFFHRNGQDIGFALPVLFTSEDGKCFIMEFCVYPEFRGNGTGQACAKTLLAWAKERGAQYAELNYGGDERLTVEILDDPTDWQLLKLENGFKRTIGEDALTRSQQEQLQQAVREGRITFFFAKRGYRAVGMCSVAAYYSTFSCANTGVFEDFYIEPAFRGKGIARKLAEAAQKWSKEAGIPSLTVCCAPCDEAMYRALGFDTRLGTTFAHIE